MDIKQVKNKALCAMTKHKYALAVAALGVVLMLLPLGSGSAAEQPVRTQQPETAAVDPQQQLQQILSRIDGAGEVEVLLTYASGSQTVYQVDTDISENGGTARYDTVVIRDSDGSEAGLVQQVIPAKYLGAVVVCQGANMPAVKLAIVEAVSKATGLGADQISVLKMK